MTSDASFDLLLKRAEQSAPEYVERLRSLNQGFAAISVTSPAAGYRYLLLALAIDACRDSVVVVCPSVERAEDLAALVRGMLAQRVPSRPFVVLPELGVESMEYTQYSRPLAFARSRALHELSVPGSHVVFTTVQALIDPALPTAEFEQMAQTLVPGDRVPQRLLAERLVRMGFEGVTSVTDMGQFSIRGNVFDVYAQAGEYPARIVYGASSIERIKLFDPVTQLSVETVQSLLILPPYPVVPDDAKRRSFARIAADQWRRERPEERAGDRDMLDDLESFVTEVNGRGVNYFTYQYADPERLCGSLLSTLGRSSVVLFLDTDPEVDLAERLTSARELYERSLEVGQVLATDALDRLGSVLERLFKELPRTLRLSAASAEEGALVLSSHDLPTVTLSPSITEYLDTNVGPSATIAVVTPNPDKAMRLLRDTVERQDLLERLEIVKGSFVSGFSTEGFAVATERELFPRTATGQRKGMRFSQAISRLEDLHTGDYVVHRDYGIGIFRGISAMAVDGVTRDYISLEYGDQSLLHVPVERLGFLEKYIGDRTEIALDVPGSRRWKRVRSEAAEDAQRIAKELLATAARRYAREGFRFKPNPELEAPVVETFSYELTPDQTRAIDDVLGDLEAGKPMDRLVCGDVGFGKTEVAIRAAVRVVANGKQVAVVAPTTILAMQHFRNFEERFAPVGYNIALFSRMVGNRELAQSREKLQEGTVDIAVGTHKLLNMASSFRDIGLVIVDEEQLFGVLDKEKIKKLKAEVDVLTLSATPIPRTLESSVVGIRDISLINTPPVGRYPIRTFLMPFDEGQLVKAVRSELDRKGQVYVVHNRIMDIEHRQNLLAHLFPDARIAVAHGRLHSEQLEQVMLDFYEGRYDILLSTTIIEAGLDFPNVNTIIVDESEKLGLAQLYQLRGRVGRSVRHAYAYFFYSHGTPHDTVAFRRLEAIAAAVDFGAGLQVAMKDLELRGAGDVLGVKQSGRFSDVGYHMFLSLVEEEILRGKGQYVEPLPKPVLILHTSAYVPETYVTDAGERLSLYNAIDRASKRDLRTLEESTADRYGALPDAVAHIFSLKRLELALGKIHATAVKESRGMLVVDFAGQQNASQFLRAVVSRIEGVHSMRDSVVIPLPEDAEPLSFLCELLLSPESVD